MCSARAGAKRCDIVEIAAAPSTLRADTAKLRAAALSYSLCVCGDA
jgi:hypothetical protein